MLKETANTISKPLLILFNQSLQECVFPSSWKHANVMPLFKKGSKHIVTNYRPISLLSCVGTVFERIMFKHIYNFVHTNKLIFENQSGFLPAHSTVYQLIDIYHNICQSFNARQYTCIVFADISKAFERVWHKGLLFKLKQLGIDGSVLYWISNYLENRKQRVFIGTSNSELKHTTAGVPQGSVFICSRY